MERKSLIDILQRGGEKAAQGRTAYYGLYRHVDTMTSWLKACRWKASAWRCCACVSASRRERLDRTTGL